jgi:hypothetical protein
MAISHTTKGPEIDLGWEDILHLEGIPLFMMRQKSDETSLGPSLRFIDFPPPFNEMHVRPR